MEVLGLVIIFIALLGIIRILQFGNNDFPTNIPPGKRLSEAEERAILQKVLNQNTSGKKNVTLVIYWADTLVLLTYVERKNLEQIGRLVSLTPSEVLIDDPRNGRKVVVKRMGDPTAPGLLH